MPSVCIHVRKAYSEAEEIALMNAVHAAMVSAFGVGADDKNITLTVHPPHRFMCASDRDDPERYTNITVVGHASRTIEQKRRFYAAVVDNLEALGIPRNCSLIQLHELPPEDIAIRGGRPMSDFPATHDVAQVERWPSSGAGRSRAVSHGDHVWAVANATDASAAFSEQAAQSLRMLDEHLTMAGASRAGLLSVQVILADINDRSAFDRLWQEWVGPSAEGWPQRACVQAVLAPGLLVELVAVAARSSRPAVAVRRG